LLLVLWALAGRGRGDENSGDYAAIKRPLAVTESSRGYIAEITVTRQ
jgi:hypothetical protein